MRKRATCSTECWREHRRRMVFHSVKMAKAQRKVVKAVANRLDLIRLIDRTRCQPKFDLKEKTAHSFSQLESQHGESLITHELEGMEFAALKASIAAQSAEEGVR